MPKTSKDSLHVQLANDLELLYRILCSPVGDSEDVLSNDAGSLMSAASQCREASGEETWHYTTEVKFSIPGFKRAYPRGLKNLTVRMLLDIEGYNDVRDHPADPLSQLIFEIIIEGYVAQDRNHLAAWHLDRHPGNHNKPEGGRASDDEDGEPEDVHPRYHFHFGGKRMYERHDTFGSGLLLTTPRLAHPPLDAVLGVDFVLSNFKGADWRALRTSNPEYLKLQTRAQSRFWAPYLHSLGLCWSNQPSPPEHWPHYDPWPALLSLPSAVVPSVEKSDPARSTTKKDKSGSRRAS